MIGSFAIVVFRDGSMMYDTMSAEEIEKSQGYLFKEERQPGLDK